MIAAINKKASGKQPGAFVVFVRVTKNYSARFATQRVKFADSYRNDITGAITRGGDHYRDIAFGITGKAAFADGTLQ